MKYGIPGLVRRGDFFVDVTMTLGLQRLPAVLSDCLPRRGIKQPANRPGRRGVTL